ncbi:6-phosphofructokinase 1 [Sporomusaceae bacterium BoRhaA]|uniref:6-phosphofructokinase n=1 Tax=Pelorhabdus rhamnosifermentans TaxID=2772457 RepID=UPI001FECFC6D|nr:6-phosphofructokinase [Pelorhabdus rhamnosifermentans]MBU2699891.1 6-phosphofructokinase 1 [Pelorhabdus rhamnosifermentans]
MNQINKIGVLTSGGDSPGMNATIRSVVRAAIGFGLKVVGVRRGYNGLIHGDVIELNALSVSDIIQKGGTFLYTARCKEFMEEAGREKAVEKAHEFGIDGLVVIGGDGSFCGAEKLSELGIPTIGIPGTIDNDIACTEYSIGFDTACNIGMEAVDRLRDTTQSHEKCSLVEVMGRRAGYLALNIGIATGATAILVPEKAYDVKKDICNKILAAQKQGKTNHIIIVAEGCKDHVGEIAKQVEAQTGIDTRITILGHIQRGGTPTVLDRVNATRMGYHAVELLHNGMGNRLVAIKQDLVVDYSIEEGMAMQKSINEKLYEIN